VVVVVEADDSCRVIMQNGLLLPGMTMPVLGPPPPDPHPNRKIQAMRDAWCLKIIGWEAVAGQRDYGAIVLYPDSYGKDHGSEQFRQTR
jgi:hypothetical protein